MLTEICQEIRNWFDRDLPKYYGEVNITDGTLDENTVSALGLKQGQYFRIIGSIFNDGVYKYTNDLALASETFKGGLWAMRIPPAFLSLVAQIEEWQDKYGGVNSANMSPYNSESFGGYSYSKSGGGSADGTSSGAGTWQGAFAKSLNAWRKI